jgi:hypothetical protein
MSRITRSTGIFEQAIQRAKAVMQKAVVQKAVGQLRDLRRLYGGLLYPSLLCTVANPALSVSS